MENMLSFPQSGILRRCHKVFPYRPIPGKKVDSFSPEEKKNRIAVFELECLPSCFYIVLMLFLKNTANFAN